MPFTIDEDTLLIKGRKGDTASFTFNFNKDMSSYTICFFVKKSTTTEDSVIEKIYANPAATSVTVNLTTEDTTKLSSLNGTYKTYYWGVKIINGTEFAQTLIPQEFQNPPKMYIYPAIGGV